MGHPSSVYGFHLSKLFDAFVFADFSTPAELFSEDYFIFRQDS